MCYHKPGLTVEPPTYYGHSCVSVQKERGTTSKPFESSPLSLSEQIPGPSVPFLFFPPNP
jgi:hypothetical protein